MNTKNYHEFINYLKSKNIRINYTKISEKSSKFCFVDGMKYMETKDIEGIQLYVNTIEHTKDFVIFEKIDLGDGGTYTCVYKF